MRRAEAAGYDVYCGIDVGKESHCVRALAPDGETELLARRVAQDEGELAALFADLAAMGPRPGGHGGGRRGGGAGDARSRTIALEVGDVSRFPSHSALAAYVGAGKCSRESGKTRGKRRRRSYNRRLRAAMFESARMAIRRPGPDRDYYERKLAGRMNERQALHALARKRVSIMHAMLRDTEAYRPRRGGPAKPSRVPATTARGRLPMPGRMCAY